MSCHRYFVMGERFVITAMNTGYESSDLHFRITIHDGPSLSQELYLHPSASRFSLSLKL